jgi:hypothetical protein
VRIGILKFKDNYNIIVKTFFTMLNLLITKKNGDNVYSRGGRSSSPVGYGIGIAEVVGSNPTRSTNRFSNESRQKNTSSGHIQYGSGNCNYTFKATIKSIQAQDLGYLTNNRKQVTLTA